MNYIPLVISEADYYAHCNSSDGVCTACGEIRIGSTEPDAENYPCEACGERKVIGIELAMMLDYIEIVD
jgi:hypothetical protein